MKYLIFIAFIGAFSTIQAKEVEVILNYTQLADSLDTTLKDQQSRYTFQFSMLDGSKKRMIYSIDGEEKKVKLRNNSFEIVTTPGKHIFQFYYSENYAEVYTDSIEIKNRFHSSYRVFMFESREIYYDVDKPVIYLYPEKKTEVELTLNTQGKPTFYYPAYENAWKFTASPTGDLSFGENTYNYLFWESKQTNSFSQEDLKSGFNVEKNNVVSFLEEKLDLAGLNSKEKADFITYWGPRLSANDLNFVRFEFNETCDRYAEIEITPEPEAIYRIYMIWMPIDKELDVTEQKIERYSREGFTVLEWGGLEIPRGDRLESHLKPTSIQN